MIVRWNERSLADVSARDDWLSPWERSHLSTLRIPKRRTDWRLGRWTAKHAVIAYLGLPDTEQTLASICIQPENSGAPEVFLAHVAAKISISLSHSDGVAACAVGPREARIGCDLERVEPRTDLFVADYFTPHEQALILRTPEANRCAWITLIWSAKESALKALRTGLRSDTHCVSVTVHDDPGETKEEELNASNHPPTLAEPMQSWRSLHVDLATGERLPGWWCCQGGFVRTLVCR